MTLSAKDVGFEQVDPQYRVTDKTFVPRGDRGYTLTFKPAGVRFEVDRLRRDRHELTGELVVRVNGQFPEAKSVDGMLTIGDFNFSSVQARSTRAKLLRERSGVGQIDWHGLLEEFCVRVVEAERLGAPPVDLAKPLPGPEEDAGDDVWMVGGFPLLRDHPTLLYAEAGSGKSYLAMYLAGLLVQLGRRVLYCDWEFSARDHQRRLFSLFTPPPDGLQYLRCERPIRDETDRIARYISDYKIKYLICDSVAYACNHRPEDAENANEYFRALRSFRVGSLNLAHVTRLEEGERADKIFGSQFWFNGARSVWFMQLAKENPSTEKRVGLYHRKYNSGRLFDPMAYRLVFGKGRTEIEPTSLADIEELTSGLPVLERVKRYLLNKGPETVKNISDDLAVAAGVIRMTITRHPDAFVKLGDKKIGVKAPGGLEF